MKQLIMLMFVILLSPSMMAFDPMAPPSLSASPETKIQKESKPKPSWVLTQTVVTDKRRVAVINGKVLNEGSTHKGWLLVKIESGAVALTRQGRQKKLVINSPMRSVKQRKDPL